MKRINFIQPIPLIKKNEFRLWSWLCMISILLLFGGTIISCMQWYLYRSLAKQTDELRNQLANGSTITAEQRTSLDEQKQLEKELDAINRYKNNPKNPLSILTALRKATHGMTLQTISITPHHFALSALCASTAQASSCIKKLNQEPDLAHILLTSLQAHHDKIEISITGKITNKLRN